MISVVIKKKKLYCLFIAYIAYIDVGELWPACLPTVPVASYAGQTATVVGWGRTEGKKGTSAR